MPTQPQAFLTPKRKQNGNLRTKISAASTPKTFPAITKNLLRIFAEDAPTMTPTADVHIPDFSGVKFPSDMTAAAKKEIIEKMALQYAASWATKTMRKSTPKISFKDIETQHANDVKPIADPIKDTQNSFLSGLFQFRRAREQFRGWDSVTYISKHQAANSDVDSDDDSDMQDANRTFFYCAKCGRWSTTHSTDGMTHNGVSISKHEGSSFNKKRDTPSKQQSHQTKKSKGHSSSVNGLKSLKAEIQQQNGSSVFDLIKAAAGEQ